jgi:pilus assembly protein CpaB
MNRKMRTFYVLAVALAMALAASYAAYVGLQQMNDQDAPASVPVVVAARELAVGTMLTAGDVKVVQWPADSQMGGAVASVDDAVGRGVVFKLAVNEPLTTAKLAARGAGAGLSPTIPPGMRAMAIRINDVAGVAGFIVPDSRVDVLVTMESPQRLGDRRRVAHVVVSNVQVLTAGNRSELDRADGKTPSVVTVLVTPEDAERIALAQSQGEITLTLRNTRDTVETASSGAQAKTLLYGASNADGPTTSPVRTARPRVERTVAAAVPAAAPAPYTVETIRGAKRAQETVK